MEQWRDSLTVLSRAITQNPQSVDLRLRKAAVNLELSQWDYAVDEYGRVLELDAKNLTALFFRAYAHNQLRHYDQAVADYDKLLSLVPNEVCEKAPQGKFAETYWREVLMKSDPTALYNMLKTISQANDNADIVLCDFSAPSEHNYRRQIAAWLQYYLHVVVDECPVIAETKGVKLQ